MIWHMFMRLFLLLGVAPLYTLTLQACHAHLVDPTTTAVGSFIQWTLPGWQSCQINLTGLCPCSAWHACRGAQVKAFCTQGLCINQRVGCVVVTYIVKYCIFHVIANIMQQMQHSHG
jgi:hypothetical protein